MELNRQTKERHKNKTKLIIKTELLSTKNSHDNNIFYCYNNFIASTKKTC